MKNYYTILSKRGEAIFKGGNQCIMAKGLIEFKAKDMKDAKRLFWNHLNETIGTTGEYHYNIVEVE